LKTEIRNHFISQVSQYDIVILPKFGAGEMVQGHLAKKTKRKMLDLGHGILREVGELQRSLLAFGARVAMVCRKLIPLVTWCRRSYRGSAARARRPL
jgi:hypothetical protein